MMTNEEFYKLDEQVARLVFGFWFMSAPTDGLGDHWYGLSEEAGHHLVYCSNLLPGRQLFGLRGNGLPYFSQDMSAAWKVVEKLRSLGFDILVSTEDSEWEVEINTTAPLYEQGHHGVIIADSDPARAICRAAIRVMTKQ